MVVKLVDGVSLCVVCRWRFSRLATFLLFMKREDGAAICRMEKTTCFLSRIRQTAPGIVGRKLGKIVVC